MLMIFQVIRTIFIITMAFGTEAELQIRIVQFRPSAYGTAVYGIDLLSTEGGPVDLAVLRISVLSLLRVSVLPLLLVSVLALLRISVLAGRRSPVRSLLLTVLPVLLLPVLLLPVAHVSSLLHLSHLQLF